MYNCYKFTFGISRKIIFSLMSFLAASLLGQNDHFFCFCDAIGLLRAVCNQYYCQSSSVNGDNGDGDMIVMEVMEMTVMRMMVVNMR